MFGSKQVAKFGIIPEPAGLERTEVCCLHIQTVQTPAMTPKVPHLNLKSLAGVLLEGPRAFHVPDTSMTEWGKSASMSSVGGVSPSEEMSHHPTGNGQL